MKSIRFLKKPRFKNPVLVAAWPGMGKPGGGICHGGGMPIWGGMPMSGYPGGGGGGGGTAM